MPSQGLNSENCFYFQGLKKGFLGPKLYKIFLYFVHDWKKLKSGYLVSIIFGNLDHKKGLLGPKQCKIFLIFVHGWKKINRGYLLSIIFGNLGPKKAFQCLNSAGYFLFSFMSGKKLKVFRSYLEFVQISINKNQLWEYLPLPVQSSPACP